MTDIATTARAYPLTLDAAARAADMAPDRLRRFAEHGSIPMLLVPPKPGSKPDCWFNPDDITELVARVEQGRLGRDEVRNDAVVTALHAYLKECPPTADYDRAVELGLPVLAKDKSNRLYAHILIAAFNRHAYAMRHNPLTYTADPVRRTLVALGAEYKRGIRPLSEKGQRWNAWWRLPRSMWQLSREQELSEIAAANERRGESGGISLEPPADDEDIWALPPKGGAA